MRTLRLPGGATVSWEGDLSFASILTLTNADGTVFARRGLAGLDHHTNGYFTLIFKGTEWESNVFKPKTVAATDTAGGDVSPPPR